MNQIVKIVVFVPEPDADAVRKAAGDAGAGKTWSLATLIEAGLEVFVLTTEPNGMDSLLDAVATKKLPLSKLHWHAVSPASPGWDGLIEVAK